MSRRRIHWQVDNALLWMQTFDRWWGARLKGVEFAFSSTWGQNTLIVQKITTPRIVSPRWLRSVKCSRKWRRWSLCSGILMSTRVNSFWKTHIKQFVKSVADWLIDSKPQAHGVTGFPVDMNSHSREFDKSLDKSLTLFPYQSHLSTMGWTAHGKIQL